MKKVFEAPYLKVVEVKNDVIATSPDPSFGGGTYGDMDTQSRRGFSGCEEDWE